MKRPKRPKPFASTIVDRLCRAHVARLLTDTERAAARLGHVVVLLRTMPSLELLMQFETSPPLSIHLN